MALKIGIVGLPNVGKSTLFKALTKQSVEIANYPFATIDPNIGIVPVPDERLEKLASLSHSKKIVPATVEFVDIAGLVKGAAEGEGLGNKFLSHIKEVDAIVEVVRVFEDPDIIHVDGAPNPLSDIEVLEYELILKDLETASKRRETLDKDVRARKKGAEEEMAILEKIIIALKEGRLIRVINFEEKEKDTRDKILSELQLLTAKPIIYVFNASEKQIENRWEPNGKLKQKIGNTPYTVISAKLEAEFAELSDEERKEYLRTFGLAAQSMGEPRPDSKSGWEENGLEKLIKVGYKTLGLVTFLTTGEDETRAWTIPENSTAPRAGRAIHSDFEEKFIRAEVINWQKLLETGSYAKARELGLLRIEGKEYIVKDGDVIEFKI